MRTPTREMETQLTQIDAAAPADVAVARDVAPSVMQSLLEAVRRESQQIGRAHV